MGNLLTLHKDIRQHLVKNYIDKYDLLILWRLVGIIKPLHYAFFEHADNKGYIKLFKKLWQYRVQGIRYCDYDLAVRSIKEGDFETLKWLKNTFHYDWAYLRNWNYKDECMRKYKINCLTRYAIKEDRPEIFKWFENDFITNKEAYEKLLEISQDLKLNNKTTNYIKDQILKF